MMKHWLLAVVLGLSACGGDNGERTSRPAASVTDAAGSGSTDETEKAMATLEGTLFYRERMMLRPGSELHVQLEDVSRADAPATVLASQVWPAEGAPPYSFTLSYEADQIQAGNRYAIRGRITNGDRLLFTTTRYIDPFAGSSVQVLVEGVPARAAPAGPGLEDVRWVLATLDGAPAGTGAGGKAPDITFDADEGRAAGFSGCNRFSGSYSREGASEHGAALAFGNMMSTMMACREGMELEQRFLKTLPGVDNFVLDDGSLVLKTGARELATFEPADE